MKIWLITLYPLVLLARGLEIISRRDPLRLREPHSASLWIVRDVQPSQADYFTESSSVEGCGHGGLNRLVAFPLRWLASWYAPKAETAGNYLPAVDREEEIPDEVYTLW